MLQQPTQATTMPLSLSEQLFQAYADSVRKAKEEDEEENLHTAMVQGETTMMNANNIVSPPPQVQVLDANKASVLAMGATGAPMLHGHMNGSTFNANATSTTLTIHHHGLHQSTMEAWDQIGNLANEVSHSVVVKQAEIVNELAKRDNRIRKQQRHDQADLDDDAKHIKKRQKTSSEPTKNDENVVVSSSSTNGADEEDDHEDISCDTETVAVSSLSSGTDEEDALARQVERMIRMTSYIAEMERIHSLFRSEMERLAAEEYPED